MTKNLKTRFFIGIILWVITIPLNHVDVLFPTVTTFTFLGNSYPLVEGFTSIDIIWTVMQKLNLIIAALGTLFIIKGIIPTVDKTAYKILKYTFIGFSLVLVYLAIQSVRYYISGFTTTTFFLTYIFIVTSFIEIAIIINVITKRSRKQKKLKQKKLTSIIEDLQQNHQALINDVNFLEKIPSEMEKGDFIEGWQIVAQNNARAAYEKIAANMKKTDKIENI